MTRGPFPIPGKKLRWRISTSAPPRASHPRNWKWAKKIGNEYRFVKALPVQPLCLSCHGPADQLSPAIKAALGQNYPNDRAIGYSEGQIRGVISVRKTL